MMAPSSRPPVPTAAVPPLRRLSFAAMGTHCEVQYACALEDRARVFEGAAVAWVQAFEAKFSRFRPDSLVSRINAAAGRDWVEVDAEMERMLDLCHALHGMTQGLLDATALPLIRLWNYKSVPAEIPADNRVAAARELVGWPRVQRAPGRVFLPRAGMALDFGGFGKEYAVDVVAQIAEDHGLSDVLVDFGHDLRALGRPPGRPCWHIGLEDPQNPGTAAGSLGISGRGVASSGDYLRCFEINGRRYGHIIDPRTGWPAAAGCTQVTVVAATCLQAGVLSTTALMLGVARGLDFIQSFPGAEGLLGAGSARAQTRGFFNYVVST